MQVLIIQEQTNNGSKYTKKEILKPPMPEIWDFGAVFTLVPKKIERYPLI